MATHTIGTGGDFSTPQLWEDDLPATMTEQRIGQLKNQEFTASGSVIDFSAHATTSSFNVIFECAAGASFKDNANVRTNALRYNSANGAAIRTTSTSGALRISGSVNHLTIRGIQIANSGSAYNNLGISQGGGASTTNLLIQDCIVEVMAGSAPAVQLSSGSGTLVVNCCIIQRNGSGDGFQWGGSTGTQVIGCTIVAPSNNTSSAQAANSNYQPITVKNCALFGFAVDADSLTSGSDYNATSFSDAGSTLPDNSPDHNVYDVAYDTTLFQQPSDSGGNHDFRLKSGNGLADAGIYDATNSPNDISGTVRANPPDIGAWELAAANQTVSPGLINNGVTLFDPAITTGGAVIAPGRISLSMIFYAPVITGGAITEIFTLAVDERSFAIDLFDDREIEPGIVDERSF